MATSVEVEVEGRRLALSNLDKVLYHASGTTKGSVIDYYRRIAPVMLPHLRRRAPTLVRAPDGPDGEVFFEKHCPGHAPDWMKTAHVGRYGSHRGYEACLIDELPALVWVANLAALELHTHQATVDEPEHPTSLVLDLDPGESAGLTDCARVACELRDVLGALGLVVVVKTSGGKGLHLNVPLVGSTASAEETSSFAKTLGDLLGQRDPQRVTTAMAKDQRRGKVFVDWSQNARFKTTVAPYSLRIRSRPTVSTPLTWDEVEAVAASEPIGPFELDAVLERIDELGDLYDANLSRRQQLPDLGAS